MNYFISSSVLGRVVSETNGTGAKLKTFVQANGALLAEQVVTEYGQTSYEILRFLHQDASGTGVQQTLADGTLAVPNARTAEYDAMGRNVADPGPYVMLNTQLPSENGSGIDLFGNGEGYRPGRVTYTYHGMVVPESYARQFIESGQIGGAFGLLEMAVRMSVRYEVDDHWGNTVYSGSNWGEAARLARRTETLTVYRTFNDSSWSIINSIVSIAQSLRLAPLDDRRNQAIQNALAELTAFLKKGEFSDKCKKNVIDKLNGIPGFSMKDFISFLEKGGEFYDGTKSRALAKEYNPAFGFGPETTIADTFKSRPEMNARTANGINTRLTVFLRPNAVETGSKASRLTGAKISGLTNDNLAFLFHEGLHGFGHDKRSVDLFDSDLQKTFGLTVGAASINISSHIKENCF